jgi:HK97 family phage major capsid protein/HK97 family phage prohead protease
MDHDVERRALAGLEVRTDGGRPRLVGYAAVFESRSLDLGGFVEVVKPGAFTRTLAAGTDVRALVNHDPSQIIGRTKAGTLTLAEDARGLRVEITPTDTTTHGRNAIEDVRSGNLDGMSFGFITRQDSWTRGEPALRELHDVDLIDVSVVTFPAYPSTEVAVRAFRQWQEGSAPDAPAPIVAAETRAHTAEGDPPMPEITAPAVVTEPTPPIPPVAVDTRDVEVVDAESRILKPSDSMRTWLERSGRVEPRARTLALGALLRAMVCGPRTDAERRALAEGTDSTGGFTVPDITAASFIDKLRAATVCVQAGARTIPLSSDKTTVARLATDVTVAWRLENAEITAADNTYEGVVFVPRSLAALIRVSRELLEDSVNIEAMLERSFAGAFAVEVDRVALRGTGTAPEPRGITNTTNVNSIAGGGPQTSYDKLCDAVGAILADNAPMPTAAVMSPAIFVQLAKLKETSTTAPLARPPLLDGITFSPTTGMPDTTAIVGGFTSLLLGVRSSLRVEVLRERYGEFLQVGFLGHLRMDVALEHPEAFAQITGLSLT